MSEQVEEESWECNPGFAVELVVEGDGYTGFSPTFAQLEDVCLQALEQCVTAAGSIPRVGTAANKGQSFVCCQQWCAVCPVTQTASAAAPIVASALAWAIAPVGRLVCEM